MPLKEICGNHKESNAATMEINAPSVPQLPLTTTHLLRQMFCSRPSLLLRWDRSSGLMCEEPLLTSPYFLTESSVLKALLQHPPTLHWIINSTSIQRKHTCRFLQHPAFEGLPFSLSTRLKVV